jgi:hypothetical protein
MFYQFYLLLQQPRVRGRALKHWGFWALATAFGWALAGFAGLPIGRVVFAEAGARAVLSVLMTMGIFGTLIGAMIGTSQWLYLRWRIREARWWIPATALGWGVGLPLALSLNMLAGFGLSALLYGVVIGAAVGLIQWLLLKRCASSAARWIPISVVALPVGIALAGMVDQQLAVGSSAAWEQMRWGTALSGGVAGLFVGLLTGITLLVLLSRRRESGQKVT